MGARSATKRRSVGGLFAFAAYLWWGFLPLYFLLLTPTGAWELVGWRIVLSLVLCIVLLALTRTWRRLLAVMREPRLLVWTAIAGVLIYVNWQIFVLATLSGHVIETSLGYFINPLVTVLLGVVVLRERLRPAQWAAMGIAVVAVVVIVVGYGAFPWIALGLACSFGVYGLVKSRIGAKVDAVSGLTLESLWLMPVAIIQLLLVAGSTGITFANAGPVHAVLLGCAGIATAVPLLLFAAGTRRAPLSLVGILQFVTPIMQFITGAWVLGEEMTPGRWVGFCIVWVALIVFSVDSVRAARRARDARKTGESFGD